MDFMLGSKDYFQKNQKTIGVVLVVIVVIIAGLAGYNIVNKGNEKKVQAAFGTAMISYEARSMDKAIENLKIVADKYPGSAQGLQSAYLLGGIFFDESKYDDAQKYFEIASKEKKEFIGAQSLEGLAACYEAKGDIASSVKYLEKALVDPRISYRHSAIRWKIALLNQTSDAAKTKKLCNEIIADTTAVEYHQPAENLITVLDNAG